jgi:hypothetical protein
MKRYVLDESRVLPEYIGRKVGRVQIP